MGLDKPTSGCGKFPGHHWYHSFKISHHLHNKSHAQIFKRRNNVCCLIRYWPLQSVIVDFFSRICYSWLSSDWKFCTPECALCKEHSSQLTHKSKKTRTISDAIFSRMPWPQPPPFQFDVQLLGRTYVTVIVLAYSNASCIVEEHTQKTRLKWFILSGSISIVFGWSRRRAPKCL